MADWWNGLNWSSYSEQWRAARCQWFPPVIPVIYEAKIWRIWLVWGQPRQIVLQTLSPK
jgi:hypothetical protein